MDIVKTPWVGPQPIVLSSEWKQRLVDFITTLNTPPGSDEIKEHPFIKSSLKDEKGKKLPVKYVPIEVTEAKLNHYFFGLWETYDFHYQVVVNEIVGDLILSIYHPEAGIWLRRVGCGAVMIQQKARGDDGEKLEQDLLDINRKIANTLVKDMGHLKSECIKNAAKSLGQSFGANLNRDIEDIGFRPEFALTTDEVLEQLTMIKTKDDLLLFWDQIPTTIQNDKRVKNLFTERRLQINKSDNEANKTKQ